MSFFFRYSPYILCAKFEWPKFLHDFDNNTIATTATSSTSNNNFTFAVIGLKFDFTWATLF